MDKKNSTLIILLFIIFSKSIANENSIKSKNIIAFSKCYGALRYFHPDSDFKSLKWNDFVEMCIDSLLQNDTLEIKNFLSKSFSFLPNTNFTFDSSFATKVNPCNNDDKYFTNYHGYSEKNNFLYYTERLKTRRKNYLKKIIVYPKLYLTFNAYSCNKNTTIAPSINYKSPSITTEYITNLIMVNALCNQFYPDKSKLSKLNTLFEDFIKKMILCNENESDLMFVLKSYTALLDDGHILLTKTNKISNAQKYLLGVDWELTPNYTLIVKETHPLFSELKEAEIVAINNIPIKEKINYYQQIISNANPENTIYKATDNLKVINDTNNMILSIITKQGRTKNVTINNYLTINDYLSWESKYIFPDKLERINDSIVYIDLTKLAFKEVIAFLEKNCKSSDYLFFEMRGRPTDGDCFSLLSFLSSKEIIDSFLHIPISNIDTNYFEKSFWKITPSNNIKINYKNIFILIDHKTFSYGESLAYFLSKLPQSYLVGTTSSACNGDVTTATLNNLNFRFTGLNVEYKNNKTPVALYPDITIVFNNQKLTKEEFLSVIKNK
jgi:hypothetical protein